MSEISPRPWRITLYELYDRNGMKVNIDDYDNDDENKNLKHIVKCVNEYDSLVAEVERLKSLLKIARDKYCDKLIISTCGDCDIKDICLVAEGIFSQVKESEGEE